LQNEDPKWRPCPRFRCPAEALQQSHSDLALCCRSATFPADIPFLSFS
jgi:hypothetical protein